MRPVHHVVVSAGVSVGLQAAMHSWPATLGCFFSGILIDVDHLWDYCMLQKKFPLRYKELSDFSYDVREKKVYIFLHAYEYLIVLWLAIFLFHLSGLWLGIALGLTIHIICDQFYNPIKPLFYFITYRAINKFEKIKILSERYYQLGTRNSV